MDMLMALAVSIGVLIAVWVKVGAMASLAVPAGIVAGACFFAAGGKIPGVEKGNASHPSGGVWVWMPMALGGAVNLGIIALIVVGGGGFLLGIPGKVGA